MNWWLRIARWWAFLASASVVLNLLKRLFSEIGIRRKLRNQEIVVVHGDGSRRDVIVEVNGDKAIPMTGKACFAAKKHILAFESDIEAIRYLQENEEKLLLQEGNEICFAAYEYEPSDYAQTGLSISNNAANCARKYWESHWIEDPNEKKIGIVGFGEYAQRILEQALVVNVIAWRGPIEYHVFGDSGERYLNWHPRLNEALAINEKSDTRDSIFFHPDIGMDGISHLEELDRIILSMDKVEENMLWLNRMIVAGIRGQIHIRGNKDLLEKLQYMPQRQLVMDGTKVVPFGDDKEMYSIDVLMHGSLLQKARQTHGTYVRNSKTEFIKGKYASCTGCEKAGRCGDMGGCMHAKETWNDLTPFEKASNVAAADHVPIKRRMLEEAADHGGFDAVYLELCRIEHERWMRFYLLNNWRWAEKRNDGLRQHPSLRPFDQLTLDDQKKDWYSYDSLLKEMGVDYEPV